MLYPPTSGAVSALIAALGDKVSLDPSDLERMRADRSGHRSAAAPLILVNATSTDDVQTTMRIAQQFQVPVVTRGAGTGLAGAAMAGAGEICLSVMEMNSVLEINPVDLLAVVQPGIINQTFNDVLAERGLWWAPDPASKAISSIGGNIATGAGGLLCAKYGATREAVLGLKVVLADGQVISTGQRSVKGVTGYDLTSLMVGSEGTLGVVVEATLKLRRIIAGDVATVSAFFPTVREAALAAAAITDSGIQPSVMELLDSAAMHAIDEYLNVPGTGESRAHLVVQADGGTAFTDGEEIARILAGFGGNPELTLDPVEGERLLEVRRAMHYAMDRLGTTLIEDVSVPRSAMVAMFDAIAQIEIRYGITIPTVAHAGDGNLHPNFVFEGPDVPDHIWAAADDMFVACLKLGGTLTGEHGIGVLKKRWLRDEIGDTSLGLHHGIKSIFDPNNILNPGKMFDALPSLSPIPNQNVSLTSKVASS